MATTYNNCQMGIVDASGNLSVIYPQTKASLVSCDSAKYGGSSAVTNVQSALNNLASAYVKVAQNATDTDNFDYEVLFSGTADNTTRVEGARKSQRLKFNPYDGNLSCYNSQSSTKVGWSIDCNAAQSQSSTGPTSVLQLGNNLSGTTAGNRDGCLTLYAMSSYALNLWAGEKTADRKIDFPDKDGKVALTSDVKSIIKIFCSGLVSSADSYKEWHTVIDAGYTAINCYPRNRWNNSHLGVSMIESFAWEQSSTTVFFSGNIRNINVPDSVWDVIIIAVKTEFV